ncbi:MAG: sugar nucleotide-binding protein [Acidobacteriota bacterium]|nr:sugar nucleotide-binding protein [Acidobacteriota bacterium]
MIGVTGANGYVGSRILGHLRESGLDAIALVRDPAAIAQAEGQAPPARRYALGEPLAAGTLEGVETVVHAAYDASQRGPGIGEVNVRGSMALLQDAGARGARFVLISSLSAFRGARSLYGQAKLELEREVLARGGVALRPGLVFGRQAGGLFGSMAATLSRGSVAALPGGGWQRQFMTHDRTLAELIAAIATGTVQPAATLFAAHEAPTTLRAIAEQLAAEAGHTLRVLALPARPVLLGMRAAEALRLPLPFRSDSMLSLMNPIPLDQVAELERAPLQVPALTPELWAR